MKWNPKHRKWIACRCSKRRRTTSSAARLISTATQHRVLVYDHACAVKSKTRNVRLSCFPLIFVFVSYETDRQWRGDRDGIPRNRPCVDFKSRLEIETFRAVRPDSDAWSFQTVRNTTPWLFDLETLSLVNYTRGNANMCSGRLCDCLSGVYELFESGNSLLSTTKRFLRHCHSREGRFKWFNLV